MGRSLLVVALLATACVPDADRSERLDQAFLRVVAAEDARPSGGSALETLLRERRHDLAFIRHAAVRALGRLEDPELADAIVPLLTDPAPIVRRSAANALAQAFHGNEGDDEVVRLLVRRVAAESDPSVLGTLARSLGRLEAGPELRREVRALLVEMSRVGDFDAPQEVLEGVALGLASLIRAHPDEALPAKVVERLRELTRYRGRLAGDPVPGRIRALAVDALGRSGNLDPTLFGIALDDPEPDVGVAAARHLGRMEAPRQPELLRRVIASPIMHVALEGLLQTPEVDPAGRCRYRFAAATPPSPDRYPIADPLIVAALDGLAVPCAYLERQRSLLVTRVERLDDERTAWQLSTHALLALARVFPADAGEHLPAHVAHPNPFVRASAARVAGVLGRDAALRSLVEDPDPNVRTAALSALFDLEGHAVDAVLVRALEADDPQLLVTVSGLLLSTPTPEPVAAAALESFVRISAAERETWRDPRLALLELVEVLGDPSMELELEPFLEDYDPLVAEKVADLLSAWRGEPHVAMPRPLPRGELPGPDDLRTMSSAVVRLHMASGGTVDIELAPYEAPTNAWRFVRLVREGWFDGLTFHRWAPNFVLQGGSPAANEYQGAAAYTRDEVGLPSHWRGTIGISTRGRDTGDAQIFVNLLHNVRLDHTYTVMGRVVAGMDVVDLMMEGAVIERAEVVSVAGLSE